MLLLLAAAVLLLSSAEAGCYRGRPRPVIPPEDFFWNEQPAPLLAAEHLPRRFDWSDVDGKNLLAPSWGQHQPRYCGSCFAHGTLSMVGIPPSWPSPLHVNASPIPCCMPLMTMVMCMACACIHQHRRPPISAGRQGS